MVVRMADQNMLSYRGAGNQGRFNVLTSFIYLGFISTILVAK